MKHRNCKLSRAVFLETDIATVSEEYSSKCITLYKGVYVRTKATLRIILEAGPRMLIMSLQKHSGHMRCIGAHGLQKPKLRQRKLPDLLLTHSLTNLGITLGSRET